MKAPSEFLMMVHDTVPLVHHITNYVTVNDCANICICAGGSPVMSDAAEDVPDMVKLASSTVLNIGTLNPRTVDSMALALDAAKTKGIPVVFDPVGAGATPYRTEVASMFLARRPDVIKGNAGEIGVLSGLGGDVKGVDSHGSKNTAEAVKALAKETGAVVLATGPEDYISDGESVYVLRNGCDMLSRVSGTGCMLSSVVGCYVGACGASIDSVAAALTAFNVAAEIADTACIGPGTFKPALMDALAILDGELLDGFVEYDEL